MSVNNRTPGPVQPWHRQRMAWLVVGLPLLAVTASFATLFLAIRNPDPVLTTSVGAAEERPAVEGRNHAATGGKKAPSESR